ncbi:MAG TPA: chemotaxis protein CheA [Rectinemataceae bacterium]|nr:chemotaxis protein CheA [Rectinemataceae bacterium]
MGGSARETTAARISDPLAPPGKTGLNTQQAQPDALPNEIYLSDLITLDMVQRFLAECADLVDGAEKFALGIDKGAHVGESINDIFRAVHTIKGNAGFFGYVLLEARCMDFEARLEGVRKGGQPADETFLASVMAFIDELRAAIGHVDIREPGRHRIVANAPEAANPEHPGVPAGPASPEEYRPLGQILVDMGAAAESDIQRALDTKNRPIGEMLVESGVAKPSDVAVALEVQRRSQAVEEVVRKEIRVDTTKLDKLFELVGELITAEAMVANSPDLAGLRLDDFQKSFGNLNKISREIQETTMMIRMIPLEGLFQKMTRLVRDLSRKVDKPVDFHISGAETEMDKNVIEQISDPLVHILRNSLDHGVESKETRASAGKAAIGGLWLDARYEGSEIWISVRDDGNGLDREKIVAKAIERGLFQGDPATLPDDTVWGYIFEPGFSTAAKVTEISGRGVGLDVVRKNLERIRGQVEVRTERGRGTEFILKIPLTMAILDGITIKVGPGFYSIPLGDIIEFFKATPSQLTRTGESISVNLRGSILPLLKLGEIFGIGGAILDPESGIIIVVEAGDQRACLLIDEVVGNQQIVVKSISEYLGKVEGISGCSILGDGTVSFIIDTARLVGRRIIA